MNIKIIVLCGLLFVLSIIIYFKIKKLQEDISKLKRASIYHELEIRKLKNQLDLLEKDNKL